MLLFSCNLDLSANSACPLLMLLLLAKLCFYILLNNFIFLTTVNHTATGTMTTSFKNKITFQYTIITIILIIITFFINKQRQIAEKCASVIFLIHPCSCLKPTGGLGSKESLKVAILNNFEAEWVKNYCKLAGSDPPTPCGGPTSSTRRSQVDLIADIGEV